MHFLSEADEAAVDVCVHLGVLSMTEGESALLRLSGDALLSAATCSLPVFLLGERLPSCSVQAREEAR